MNTADNEEKEIVIVKDNKVEVVISKEEALQLTQDIKSTSTALYLLLKRAHENKAWIAMGYNSWTEYIEKEFDFSRTRSYQLINQANVIEEINKVSDEPMYISEREARSIKNRLPEITEKIKETQDDENLDREEKRNKVKEIIDEEIDNATDKPRHSGPPKDPDEYETGLDGEDNGAMEEWKPDGIDMDKMRRMLSDDDKFFFNHLITTLKIFEEMPNPSDFGKSIKKSSEDTKELLKLTDFTFSWIAQLLDEIE